IAGSSDVLIEHVDVNVAWLGEGSWSETRSVRKRILTYAGKKSDSELKVSYNPAWSDVELLEAKVFSADGTVAEISDKEVNVMDASWVGAAPRYPPSKTLVASFPAVEEGSVIEYTVKHIRRDRPFLSLRESFAG
ncbi:MAG: DUF3857 domain-containing protein, partial [Nitrospinaceae bacterium]|nr:DUF3857 domain-containing protein [Nitrospinaceae bacterium]